MSDNDTKIIQDMLTRLLASREHSRYELRNKLSRKGLDVAACVKVIEQFAARGLQSDVRYAQALVRKRCDSGYGEQRIRAELSEHQIEEDIIEQCLSVAEIEWLDIGANVLTKKFGSNVTQEWHEVQKRKRFLQYRGFTYRQISQLVE